MLVWDLSPGYLNDDELRQQITQIAHLLANRAQCDDPDVSRRWGRCMNALRCLEAWMQAERRLRHSAQGAQPDSTCLAPVNLVWPSLPDLAERMARLRAPGRESGRIAMPNTAQQLWSHYKYSVSARSMELYRSISTRVTGAKGPEGLAVVAGDILLAMRQRPDPDLLRTTLLQMWGYVSAEGQLPERTYRDLPQLMAEIQRRARAQGNAYLLNATALSELSVWLEGGTRL